ncbi:MAG: transposase [Gammaproteobacteria bacterium]|nr:transposase [Gammaproteobacteria bacterium]
MARKVRIYYPGATYHVMLRGNEKKRIFFTNEDRIYFCSLLAEGTQRFGYKVFAFCLMDNHVHLAIQVNDIPLSKIVHNFSFRYAQWINKTQQRVGHLFQGRHKAILVDADNYLLGLVRYIHLNPVRAGLVELAEEYCWSSHSVYLGYKALSWVSCNLVLNQFAENGEIAITHYQKYMQENVNSDQNEEFQSGNHKKISVLADSDFLVKLERSNSQNISFNNWDLGKLVNVICEYYGANEFSLSSISKNHTNAKIRAVIALLAQDLKICSLSAVAKYFQRNVTGLIRTIMRVANNLEFSQGLEMVKDHVIKSTSQA